MSIEQPQDKEGRDVQLAAALQGAKLVSGRPAGPPRIVTLSDEPLNLAEFNVVSDKKKKELDAANKRIVAKLEWKLPDGTAGESELDEGLHGIIEDRIRSIQKIHGEPEKKKDLRRLLAWGVMRHIRESRQDLGYLPDEAEYAIRFLEHKKRPAYQPTDRALIARVEEAIDDLADPPELAEVSFGKIFNDLTIEDIEVTGELSPKPTSTKESSSLPFAMPNQEPKELAPGSRLRLDMGNAKRTGKWGGEVAKRYTEHLSTLATYIGHRVMFLDLLKRVKSGEMRMPERFLSIASGPLTEVDAEEELKRNAEAIGAKLPMVVSLDMTKDMLIGGREAVAKKHGKNKRSFEALGLAQVLPFESGSFDLSECTELDIMRTAEDVYLTLSEMARVTKMGGRIRLYVRGTLPDAFFDAMQKDLGMRLVTKPHTCLALDPAIVNAIVAQKGPDAARAARSKVGNEEYVIAEKVAEQSNAISAEDRKTADEYAALYAGPDQERRSQAFMEALRLLADDHIDVSAYALTDDQRERLSERAGEKKPEVAPLQAPSPAPAPSLQPTEKAPPAPPISVPIGRPISVSQPRKMGTWSEVGGATYDELSSEALGVLLKKIDSAPPAQSKIMKQRVAGAINENQRRTHRLGLNRQKPGAESRQREDADALRRALMSASPTLVVAHLRPEDQISLLWAIAPRIAEDLERDGIIGPSE